MDTFYVYLNNLLIISYKILKKLINFISQYIYIYQLFDKYSTRESAYIN